MSESVLIIKNSLLQSYIQDEKGSLITEQKDQILNTILENHVFMKRDDAEYNFNHKQIIPYVIIRKDNIYLLLQRTSRQTEERLHNKYSLGIGGHINPGTGNNGKNIIIRGLYKELNEEISIPEPAGLYFIGIINDERNSVSRVHLGLLYVLDVKSLKYQILETDKMTAQWVKGDSLKNYYSDLETWSQIVHDQYIIKKRIEGLR